MKRSRTGMILDPAHIPQEHLQEILDGIPTEEWDVPDLRASIKYAGIESYRYLRTMLGLPPESGQKSVGTTLIGTFGEYKVVRCYTSSKESGGGGSWLWRRFPKETTEAQIQAVLPTRATERRSSPLPTVAQLQREQRRLLARLELVGAAIDTLQQLEAAETEARDKLRALRYTRAQ